MNRYVLDASFTVTWIVESEQTLATLKYYHALSHSQSEALVPAIWADEISNVLMTLERVKKVSSLVVAAWVDILSNLPIQIQGISISESLREVRQLAKDHKLTVYDARYLHLALHSNLPLATRDKELITAAAKIGVNLAN